MKKKKTFISILSVLLAGLLITGVTFAFWIWQSEENVNINVTMQDKDFSCSADGGGNITSNDVTLQPTFCTDTTHAIVREIHTNIVNNTGESLGLNLWLDVNSIATELANTTNFKWAITTSNEGCNRGTVINNGSFKDMTAGDKVILYNGVASNSTYYLYIWLDEEETAPETAGKAFNLSLNGDCNDVISIPNQPVLVEGLIPVKISSSGNKVFTSSVDDPEWYNYENKEWANAVLVNENTHTRSYYLTNPDELINTSDILAYYVWIPRYSYRVWQYRGLSSTGQEQEINIKFVAPTTKDVVTKNGDWYTPKAFTFGDKELSGIWVGKFETSHTTLSSSTTDNNLGEDSGTICNVTGCSNYTGLRILPNVQSLRYNRISNYFYASRAMESNGNPFGLVETDADSHMMKNSEWSAITYLSHSKYGINEEVRINNQNTCTTGCGATAANASGNATCSNQYGGQTTYPQSTTGNVTGVFDMSGGCFEYVMCHYGAVTSYGNNSGFSASNPLPLEKYYDNYSNTQFNGTSVTNFTKCTFDTCGGQALSETKEWYGDGATFMNAANQWSRRGGSWDNKAASGIFATSNNSGMPSYTYTFRLVLVKE